MNWIVKIYKGFEQIGVTDNLSFSEKLRVELSNIVLLSTLPMLLFTIVTEFLKNSDSIEVIINVFWSLVMIPPLIFNYFHKHALAKYWVVITGTLFTTFLIGLYGRGLQMEPLYLVYIICAFYFFEIRTSVILTIGIFAAYFLFMIYGNVDDAPLKHLINPSSNIMAFLYSVLIIGILTYKVLIENKNFHLLSLKQQKSLEVKNEELERFAYIAAHDLKTPLRNLYSYIGLIEMKYNKSNPQINDYILSSKKSAEQLHNLISDILNYSTLESSTSGDELIDLNKIVDEVKSNFSHLIHNKSLIVNSDLLPTIRGDALQIKLLFQNLIENGIKYNESTKPSVYLKSELNDSEVIIYFKDNGIGIEQKYIDQIFTMFTRLHASDEYSGSGLGLAISKRIVERHGGTISVQSTHNEQTTFSVVFPQTILN